MLKQRNLFFLSILLVAALQVRSQKVQPPAAVGPVPTPAQLRWHEMELNAFVHFTTNTFTGLEWGYGDEKETVFNPTATDVDQWASTLKKNGFKTLVLTCKHHDGFCLWPSKYTEHSIKNSPYKNGKGDLVKEVAEACRKHGLKFGVYLSPWDRNRDDYGQPAYVDYYRNQLRELFTDYGPIVEMWFDGANGGDGYYGGAREKRKIDGATYYDWPTTLKMVDSMQKEVIYFSDAGPGVRWVGNEQGIAGKTNYNTISTDTIYAGKSGIQELLNTGSADGDQWVPAEVDVSIRPGWFYHEAEDSLVKTPEQLFDIYLTSVGRGSTLLLNIPPDKRGRFHEKDVESLAGFRKMLDSVFARNLTTGAVVTATNTRGKAAAYAPAKMIDKDKNSYWATDDGLHTASFDITLPKSEKINYVVLQEYIPLGQRVHAFTIETFRDGAWQEIGSGTTIGYKRIVAIENVNAKKIRVNILAAKACPLISNVAIY